MDTHIIAKSKHFVSNCMKENGGKEYTYHNFEHTSRVEEAARKLADAAKLSEEDRELLVLAAIYHDVGFCFDAETHEIKGGEMAERKLKELGVKPDKAEIIDPMSKLLPASPLRLLLRNSFAPISSSSFISMIVQPPINIK